MCTKSMLKTNNNLWQVSGIIYMTIQHAQSNRGAPHSKLGSPNCKCHPLRMIASCELLISLLVHQIRESAVIIIVSTTHKLYDSRCSQSNPIKTINVLINSNELNFHAGRSDLEFFIYKLPTFLLRARK